MSIGRSCCLTPCRRLLHRKSSDLLIRGLSVGHVPEEERNALEHVWLHGDLDVEESFT